MKKLFMLIVCIFCIYTIGAANSDIVVDVDRGDFTIANLKETGNSVKFDLFVRGKASSVVEIYDKDGKRIGYKVAEGTRESSDFIDGTGEIILKPFLPGYGSGHISSNVSQKSTIEFDIPKGGSFKITKSSNLASAVNFAEIGLELAGKIGLPDELKNDNALFAALTENTMKSIILAPGKTAISREFDSMILLEEIFDVLKSSLTGYGSDAVKQFLGKAAEKSLNSLISVAEISVFALQTDMVRRNIEKHIKNPDNHTITAYHTSDNLDKNKNKLSLLKNKDKEIKETIEKINEKNNVLDTEKDTLEDLKKELNDTKKLDSKKFIFLLKAKRLVEKYGDLPLNKWSKEDQSSLESLASSLGITYSNTVRGAAIYLKTKISKGEFIDLRDKYALTIEYATLLDRVYDLEAEINSFDTLQSDLKKLESEKKALLQEIEDSTDDYNNDSKEELTSQSSRTSPEGKWLGISISYIYDKNNDNLVSTASSMYQPGGYDDIEEEDEILDVSSSGNVNKVTFTVGGLNLDSITANDNYKTLDATSTNGLRVQVIGSDDDSYIAWGTWNDETVNYGGNSNHALRNSYWIAGQLTPNSDIPQTGSAIYNGSLVGINTTTSSSVSGNVAITTNFGAKTMSGTLDVTGFATGHLNSVNIHTGTKGTVFSGSLIGSGISYGDMAGAFYGDKAKAIGGVWSINKTDSSHATGVFNAKK